MVHNEVLMMRTKNNDIVKRAAALMEEIRILQNKLRSVDAERQVNQDMIFSLVRKHVPEIGFEEMSIDFEEMSVSITENSTT